jgi:hypothetical protein
MSDLGLTRLAIARTWTHKTHHSPNLGKATTFPLIVYSVPLHKAHIQMAFCPSGFQFPKWEFIWEWECSFSPTLLYSQPLESMKCDSRLHSWFAPLQALALIASPRLRLRHWNWRKIFVLILPIQFCNSMFCTRKTATFKLKARINLCKFVSGIHAPCYLGFWV